MSQTKDEDLIQEVHLTDGQINSLKNKSIIVDSCVLLYCEGQVFKSEIRKILRTLVNNKNRLGISLVSGFEVLSNSEIKFRKYFVKLLNYFKNIDVNRDILSNGVVLYRSYGRININYLKSISPCDFIIGGTAIYLKDAVLFTGDRRHFPSPIWDIVATVYITYKSFEEYRILNLYLLQPNIKIINKLANEK